MATVFPGGLVAAAFLDRHKQVSRLDIVKLLQSLNGDPNVNISRTPDGRTSRFCSWLHVWPCAALTLLTAGPRTLVRELKDL